MPKINLLPKSVAELIAAGEVVERPSSVIKELVENAIDAGAENITLEIQRGGISYIRVTDNGCGIAYTDVPTAFLRHATSKIKIGADLDSISTLGFRGEALAAISSVARVEMLTKTAEADTGARYIIEGGEERLYEESGCPNGTTIIIRDIFFNTPARMKFLKKDVSEANSCAAVIDRIALSHPEIAFKFIRDGKQTLSTSGNGDIKSAIYSVLGREFASSLIEVSNEASGVRVSGFTCKPVSCKPTRNGQYTFLNGRLVRSGTVTAAAEQAYKNSAMTGKFPGFVLYLSIPFDTVDVNVHPAKTEVRFSDEKRIFDAVYVAIKSALNKGDTRPQINLKAPAFNPFERMSAKEYRQQAIKESPTIAEKIYNYIPAEDFGDTLLVRDAALPDLLNRCSYVGPNGEETEPMTEEEFRRIYCKAAPPKPQAQNKSAPEVIKPSVKVNEPPADVSKPAAQINKPASEAIKPTPEAGKVTADANAEYVASDSDITVIGEAFSTYIIAQFENSIYIIDKHAAHERILFNELKATRKCEVQQLLTPVTVRLPKEEYDVITCNTDLLLQSGFEVEDFGNSSVVVRAVPVYLTGEDLSSLISEVAGNIAASGNASADREENLLHTIACRAAVKAGGYTTKTEMQALAEKVLKSREIMYCPHGRPVAFEIKKHSLEKQFGRIQ